MWIVNWGRLAIFAALIVAVFAHWKGIGYLVHEWGLWVGLVIMGLGLLASWLMDRQRTKRELRQNQQHRPPD